MQVVLQRGERACKLLQAIEGQRTYLGILERDRLASVALGANAIQTYDIARHVVADKLLAAILSHDRRLARAQPDRIQRGERFPCAV